MVKVKVCGITNSDDFVLAERLGADYAGFIFYPGSQRYIEPDKARTIIHAGAGRIVPVGVFVDATAEHIAQVAACSGIAIAQLHGNERPDVCRRVPLPCWKAFRVRDGSFLEQMAAYSCRAFLLDAWSATAPGGTGKPFAWRWAATAIAQGKNIIVAGGVSAANVEPLLTLKPYAVDICSSLETAPGEKNPLKMELFFRKINQAARRIN